MSTASETSNPEIEVNPILTAYHDKVAKKARKPIKTPEELQTLEDFQQACKRIASFMKSRAKSLYNKDQNLETDYKQLKKYAVGHCDLSPEDFPKLTYKTKRHAIVTQFNNLQEDQKFDVVVDMIKAHNESMKHDPNKSYMDQLLERL